jgi:hypothetical protein
MNRVVVRSFCLFCLELFLTTTLFFVRRFPSLALFSFRGFTRVSKGAHKDETSHPLFLRGYPTLSQRMKRITLKGTGRGNRAPHGGISEVEAAMQQALLLSDTSSVSSSTSSASPPVANKDLAAALASLPPVPGNNMRKSTSGSTIMMPNLQGIGSSSSTPNATCNATFAGNGLWQIPTASAAVATTSAPLPAVNTSSTGNNNVASLMDANVMQQLTALIQKLHHGNDNSAVASTAAAAVPAASLLSAFGSLYMAPSPTPPQQPQPTSSSSLLPFLVSAKAATAPTSSSSSDLIRLLLQQQQQQRQDAALLQEVLLQQQLRKQQQQQQQCLLPTALLQHLLQQPSR